MSLITEACCEYSHNVVHFVEDRFHCVIHVSTGVEKFLIVHGVMQSLLNNIAILPNI